MGHRPTPHAPVAAILAQFKAHGGRVRPEGDGGYCIHAPPGLYWSATDTTQFYVTLDVAEGPADREHILQVAEYASAAGLRPATAEELAAARGPQ